MLLFAVKKREKQKAAVSSRAPFYRVSLIFKNQANNGAEKKVSEEKWRKMRCSVFTHSTPPPPRIHSRIRLHDRNEIRNVTHTSHQIHSLWCEAQIGDNFKRFSSASNLSPVRIASTIFWAKAHVAEVKNDFRVLQRSIPLFTDFGDGV